jgi:hypothetical protein
MYKRRAFPRLLRLPAHAENHGAAHVLELNPEGLVYLEGSGPRSHMKRTQVRRVLQTNEEPLEVARRMTLLHTIWGQ